MALFRKLGLATALLISSVACSDDSENVGDGTVQPGVADVLFVDGINDEALEYMLERTPQDVSERRLTFSTPAEGETLASATPATFEWSALPSASFAPRSLEPEQRWASLARELARFVNPIGTAHAHGPAYNGTAYYLEFSTAAKPRLLRVFTAKTSFTPDISAWETLAASDGDVRLSITSAIFENSLVLPDGGPFVGGTLTFRID